MKRTIISCCLLLSLGLGAWTLAAAARVFAVTTSTAPVPARLLSLSPMGAGAFAPACGPDWNVVPSLNGGAGDQNLNGVVAITSADVWSSGNYLSGTIYQTVMSIGTAAHGASCPALTSGRAPT